MSKKKALTVGVYNPSLIHSASPMCGDQVFSKGLKANGYDVTNIDYREEKDPNLTLLELNQKFDIIWLSKCEKIKEETIYELQKKNPFAKIIKFAADVRDKPSPHDTTLLKYCDFFFATFGGWYLKEHRKYMPRHAKAMTVVTFTDSDYYRKSKIKKYKTDILWTGRRGFGDNLIRNEIIDFLKNSNYNISMFGVENTEWIQDSYVDYINSAKIGIGANSFNRTLYTSDRLGNYTSCGTFYLPHYFEGMEKVFIRGETLDWFHTIPEMKEKIEYYLKNIIIREKIAKKSQEFVLKHFDYKPLVKNLLYCIKNKKSKYKWDEIY